jgi:hypothetical protein
VGAIGPFAPTPRLESAFNSLQFASIRIKEDANKGAFGDRERHCATVRERLVARGGSGGGAWVGSAVAIVIGQRGGSRLDKFYFSRTRMACEASEVAEPRE